MIAFLNMVYSLKSPHKAGLVCLLNWRLAPVGCALVAIYLIAVKRLLSREHRGCGRAARLLLGGRCNAGISRACKPAWKTDFSGRHHSCLRGQCRSCALCQRGSGRLHIRPSCFSQKVGYSPRWWHEMALPPSQTQRSFRPLIVNPY